jgi:hypothetical protein
MTPMSGTGLGFGPTYRPLAGPRKRFFQPFPHTSPHVLGREWHTRSQVHTALRGVQANLGRALEALGIHEEEPPLAEGAGGQGGEEGEEEGGAEREGEGEGAGTAGQGDAASVAGVQGQWVLV